MADPGEACKTCEQYRISAELDRLIRGRTIDQLQATVAKLTDVVNLFLSSDPSRQEAAQAVIKWMER